jgi:hypothetical protein
MEDMDVGVRDFPWLLSEVVPFHPAMPVMHSRDFVGTEDNRVSLSFK